MTPEQWHEVTRLFAKCLDSSHGERDELLADRRISESIRHEVRVLLQNLERAESKFMESLYTPAEKVPLLPSGYLLANRFRIVHFLGRGGMGEVYEAEDQNVGDAIAIKVVSPNDQDPHGFSARLRRELQLARDIAHPNVCRLFDLNRHTFPWGEGEFLTMELIRGRTLAEMMKERRPQSPEECLPYLEQILAGLQAAHELAIVHRDLKPANVMVTSERSGKLRCVLMDFGLARQVIPLRRYTTVTTPRQIMGTLPYMAPEQLAGADVFAQTDLYAFGIIMYELLYGCRPFESATGIDKQLLFPPESEPCADPVPRAWREVIEGCLQPDPSRRPASAARIAAALRTVKRKGWMNRRTLLAGAASALGAVAGVTYIVERSSHPEFLPGSSLLVVSSLKPEGDPVGIQVRALLRQSNQLALWDNARISDVWRLMGRQGAPAPSTRDWREIAMRESVEFVLFPSVMQVGDGSTLSLRLEQLKRDPDVPSSAWQKSFEAAGPERLFEAIDAGSRWIRELIGESAAAIDKTSARPQAVTTPSWDALKEFSRGESVMTQPNRDAAILAFRSAARIDPLFTMAWMRLGDVQASLGRDNDAFTAWHRAEEVSRERPLTRREDLRFRSMLASDSADYAAAEKLFKEYSFYFTDDPYGPFYRALPLLMMGRVAESIAELETCMAIPRLTARACLQLVPHYMYAGNRKSAEMMVTKLRQLKQDARAAFSEAVIAHSSEETGRALQALSRAAVDSSLLPRSKETLSKAIVLADAGKTGEAIDALRVSAHDDELAGERERWAAKLIGIATLLEMEDDRKGALRAVAPLKRVEVGPTHAGNVGILFARLGDRPQAQRLLAAIPTDFSYPLFQSPRRRIEAELQFGAGNIVAGLRLAREAAKIEPRAYGSDYLAESLERFGSKEEALSEYKDCLRAKPVQLFLATPAPAGSWYRASTAVRRLESSLYIPNRKE